MTDLSDAPKVKKRKVTKVRLLVTESAIDLIEADMLGFIKDARKLTNKSAATRARKLSLQLAPLLKDYRFNSIKQTDNR